jgi:predicted esterase
MTHKLYQFASRALLALTIAFPAFAAAPSFTGQWHTSFGIVTLTQTGNAITGTYGNAQQFTLKGTASNNQLSFEYEGLTAGDGTWTLNDTGLSFYGTYKNRTGQSGAWEGWQPDPQTLKAKPANLTGLWLTDFGLMYLKQTGDKVTGHFALHGVSDIQGTITGHRFEFTTKTFFPGKGWFDLTENTAAFSGAATDNGSAGWYAWKGRRAPEFTPHPKLIPGKIIDASTNDLLTYSIRAPETYNERNAQKWPAIVVLHGSNMNAKAYVNTIAAAWPDIAKDYLLIGINGETPSSLGGPNQDPTFNYTYVSYVGHSTFKAFPGTDRESPALVAEALDELRATYPISHYFVGGHSQGGFLTYSLLMNFPEKIAGVFPISAGVIMQCEPAAYDDQKLRAAQRAVPLAIVHSRQDQVVNFSSAEYAATLFSQSDWPAFHFFIEDASAGHRFALLPVNQAIRWLEAQSSADPKKLLDFATDRIKAAAYRDAIAALNRAASLKPDSAAKTRLDRLTKEIDAKAAPGAKQFLPKIQANASNDWITPFLEYRDNFEFPPAAKETMQAFEALRAQHESLATKVMNDARTAFQQGNPDQGYAKYQEIVDKYYAASSYRNAKRWLAERK